MLNLTLLRVIAIVYLNGNSDSNSVNLLCSLGCQSLSASVGWLCILSAKKIHELALFIGRSVTFVMSSAPERTNERNIWLRLNAIGQQQKALEAPCERA